MQETSPETFGEFLDSKKALPPPTLEFVGNVGTLMSALATAQGAFKPVLKNRKGQEGHQTYKYAELHVLWDAIREPLSANGITILQPLVSSPLGGDKHRLTTIVAGHGAMLLSHIDFDPGMTVDERGKGTIKTYGKLTTYLRRYALNALMGLDGEPDADEAPERGESRGEVRRDGSQKQRQAPQPAPRQSAPPPAAKPPEKPAPAPEQAPPPREEPRPAPQDEPPPPDDTEAPPADYDQETGEVLDSHVEPAEAAGPITDEQHIEIGKYVKQLNLRSKMGDICKKMFKKSPRELDSHDAAKLIAAMKQKAGE